MRRSRPAKGAVVRLVALLTVCAAAVLAPGCSRAPTIAPIPPDIVLLESALSDIRRLVWSHDDIALSFAATVPNEPRTGVYVVHPLIAAPPFRADAAVELVELATFDEVVDLRFTAAPRGVVAAVDCGRFVDVAGCDGFAAVWLELAEVLTPLLPVDEPVLLHSSLARQEDAYGRPGTATDHPALHLTTVEGRVALGTTAGVVEVDHGTRESHAVGPGFPIAYEPSGERLVTVEVEGGGATARRTWRTVASGGGAETVLALEPDAPVQALRWGPDGIVVLLGEPPSWQVRNLTTGAVRSLEAPAASEIHLSPSGRFVAHTDGGCASEAALGCASVAATLTVVSVATGETALVYRGADRIANLSMAHDDAWIAYTSGPRVLLSRVPGTDDARAGPTAGDVRPARRGQAR
jgi:hypothetical protein